MVKALLVAMIAAVLGIGPSAAEDVLPGPPVPIPQVFRVDAPDGMFLLAVPPGLCLYPDEVAKRLADFLVGAQPVLIGGECGGVADLLRDGRSMVAQTITAMVMDSDVDPATRRTEARLLAECREWFSSDASQADVAEGVEALNKSQTVLKAAPEVPPVLLRSDAHAVYGRTVGRLARGLDRTVQVKIFACLAPKGYPVLWLFQGMLAPDSGSEQIKAEVTSLLAAAVRQVEATLRLNAVP